MRRFIVVVLAGCCSLLAGSAGAADLPRVLVIGDSISMGYTKPLAELLQTKASVEHNPGNGGDSGNVLSHLDEWAGSSKYDVIHFNCGLHDMKLDRKTKAYQQPLDRYEANLREIVAKLRAKTKAKLIWATTTPVIDDRHRNRGAGFDRLQKDVDRYNEVALKVMRELMVPITDLHAVAAKAGPPSVIGRDGVHFTPEGYKFLANAVSASILKELAQK